MKYKFILPLILVSVLGWSCSNKSVVADQPIRTTSSESSLSQIDWGRFIQAEPMPAYGKFKGQFVETTRRRAISFLTFEEKRLIGIPENQIAFANFRHANTFYVATIPGVKVNERNEVLSTENIVDKIIFSTKHWAAKTRKATENVEVHAELGFFLKPGQGIQLWVNQDQQIKLPEIKTLKESIVYSIEAVRSQEQYDQGFFPAALGPNFAIAHRIVSNTERNIQHLDDPDRSITSRRLKFDGIQSRSSVVANPQDILLVGALMKSNQIQRSQPYEMATNNCTNNQFTLLDENLVYKNNSVDLEQVRKAYNKFLQVDLKNILDFLVDLKTKDKNLDPALKDAIDQLVSQLSQGVSSKLKDVKVDSRFLITLPALIDGHLKARGLY